MTGREGLTPDGQAWRAPGAPRVVALKAEGTGDWLRDARTTEAGIAARHFDDGGDEFRSGT